MSAISEIKKIEGATVSFGAIWDKIGNTVKISGAIAGLTVVIAAIGAIKQYYDEIDQRAGNAFQTWSQSNDSFETQIDQINKLKASLESGTLSEQEAYNAKSQLYDIQRQLISSYGEDIAGIDLVNGKIEEQTSLLRENIAAKEASQTLNENKQGIDRAIKRMEATREYELGSINTLNIGEAENKAIQSVLKKYSDSIKTKYLDDGFTETIYFEGNADDAYKVINDFMNDIRRLSGDFKGSSVIDSILNTSSKSLKSSKDILDTYKQTYEEAKRAQMVSDVEEYGDSGKTAADWMYDAVNAVEEYNKALESGDTSKIDEASKSFYDIKDSIDSLLDDTGMGKYSSMFSEVFDQVNKRLESQKNLEKELTGGTLKKHGEILKASGLTALDLKQAFDTEGLQDGETQLNAIIDLADELGYISKESKDDVYGLIDTLNSLLMDLLREE